MRTISNTATGAKIPVTKDLNIQTLTQPVYRDGKYFGRTAIKNGHGRNMMNDEWYFVSNWPFGGMTAANTFRAKYCEKMYLAEVTIQSSIGEGKLMDDDLKLFVSQVSDKLVFEKYGKWYRVFLRKINNRKFGIAKVVPYNFTILGGCDPLYNKIMQITGMHPYQLSIDWRSAFYVR